MNIIFTSPFNPLWSKGVLEIASLLDAKVVHIGDLLRAEVMSNSLLGIEIKAVLDNGEILKPKLVNDLLSQKFFDDPASKILVNYPINKMQAESLASCIGKCAHQIRACVYVNTDKESLFKKFESQFHCVDSTHPKLETSKSNPLCGICDRPMVHSYNLANDKVAYLIDSYFDNDGALSGVYTLSQVLGIDPIPYATPEEVVAKILDLCHEHV